MTLYNNFLGVKICGYWVVTQMICCWIKRDTRHLILSLPLALPKSSTFLWNSWHVVR